MSADDVTPENITALRGKIMEGSEGPMQKRSETQFRQQVVVDLLDAVEASWEREKALRTELSEAHGRIEFLRSGISRATGTLKRLRGLRSQLTERRVVVPERAAWLTIDEMEHAIEHGVGVPIEIDGRSQLRVPHKTARLLAERIAFASREKSEQAPSPDVVTVPREEWEVLNTISAFWCPPFGVPQNTATEALFAKLDAFRSGEAGKKWVAT